MHTRHTARRPSAGYAGCVLTAVLCVLLVGRRVDADPQIATTEAGSWAASVAALQADTRSEGRVLHIFVVGQRGERLACPAFELLLDDASRAAFSLGACNATLRAVPLRLDHRAALFESGGDIPQPASLGITAREIYATHAMSDGRAIDATSVRCTVVVTPALQDLVHGQRVELSPDRYELRPARVDVTAAPTGAGWRLEGMGRAELTVRYDLIERTTQRVVLSDRATLSCGASANDSATQDAACRELPVLRPGETVRADVRSALDADPAARGRVYRLELTTRSDVSLHQDREPAFDDVSITLYRGCGTDFTHPLEMSLHNEEGNYNINLPPGTYRVLLERHGREEAGTFALTPTIRPVPPHTPQDDALPELRFEEIIQGTMVAGVPTAYRFQIDRRMQVVVRMTMPRTIEWTEISVLSSRNDLGSPRSDVARQSQSELARHNRQRLGLFDTTNAAEDRDRFALWLEPGAYVLRLEALGLGPKPFTLQLLADPG